MIPESNNLEGGAASSRENGPASQGTKGKLFLRQFLDNERRLYAYIVTLLANRADADDVLQETSMVMWDKFDDANPPRDFFAWGCRIAYFKVLDFRKKSGRSRVQFSQAMLERVADIGRPGSVATGGRRRQVQKLSRDRERRVERRATTQSAALKWADPSMPCTRRWFAGVSTASARRRSEGRACDRSRT